MVVETLLIFGMGWLLGKLGMGTGKGAARAPAATPSKVPWPGGPKGAGKGAGTALEPGVELPGVPSTTSQESLPEQQAAIKDAETYHKQQQARLDSQANDAYRAAGADQAARQDIAKKYRARQKALDDYKRQIEEAKASIAQPAQPNT